MKHYELGRIADVLSDLLMANLRYNSCKDYVDRVNAQGGPYDDVYEKCLKVMREIEHCRNPSQGA